MSMRGAYTLLRQTIDSGMGPSAQNIQQLKIFTDKYVMYAHRRSEADSMAEFGVGTYRVENGKVIETMFYTAAGPGNNSYELEIHNRDNGYSQLIDFPGEERHYLLNEEYKNSSLDMTSPLDGAWRMTKQVYIDKNGKTETIEPSDNAMQFKLFESGHFMWANRWKDEKTGKFLTGYGYGTFRMNGPAQATETNGSSTFASALVGKQMKLQLKFPNQDVYEQTITMPDGGKQIETYKRMK